MSSSSTTTTTTKKFGPWWNERSKELAQLFKLDTTTLTPPQADDAIVWKCRKYKKNQVIKKQRRKKYIKRENRIKDRTRRTFIQKFNNSNSTSTSNSNSNSHNNKILHNPTLYENKKKTVKNYTKRR
jgi:hypothetical protein